MKYNLRSAEVLNSADRMQRILDHQLEVMEIQSRIWAPRVEGEWYPGDPLYPDPRKVWNHSCHCALCVDENPPSYINYEDPEDEARGRAYLEAHPDYEGNVARPMYQLLELGTSRMKCTDCMVDWAGNDPCWFCGLYTSEQWAPKRKQSMYSLSAMTHMVPAAYDISEDMHGIIVRMTAQFQPFRAAMALTAERMNEMMRLILGDPEPPGRVYFTQPEEEETPPTDGCLPRLDPGELLFTEPVDVRVDPQLLQQIDINARPSVPLPVMPRLRVREEEAPYYIQLERRNRNA